MIYTQQLTIYVTGKFPEIIYKKHSNLQKRCKWSNLAYKCVNLLTHNPRNWDVLGECFCTVCQLCRTRGMPRTVVPGCRWSSPRWHCSTSRHAGPRSEIAPTKLHNISKKHKYYIELNTLADFNICTQDFCLCSNI